MSTAVKDMLRAIASGLQIPTIIILLLLIEGASSATAFASAAVTNSHI